MALGGLGCGAPFGPRTRRIGPVGWNQSLEYVKTCNFAASIGVSLFWVGFLRTAVSRPQQCAENDFWMLGSTPQSGVMLPEVSGQVGTRRTGTPSNPVSGGVWPTMTSRGHISTVLYGLSSHQQLTSRPSTWSIYWHSAQPRNAVLHQRKELSHQTVFKFPLTF